VNQKILNYYKLIDEFLLAQFDYAMGELPTEDITIHYEGLLNYLETTKFESTVFESAKNHHLNQLKGVTTHLVGFPQFKYDSHHKVSKEELLNKRSQISSIDFLYQLKEFNQLEFSSLGLNIEKQPAYWINKNDRPISFQSSPDSLRRTLFEIDHFESKSEYLFKISPKNSGFFMMTLNLRDAFYIGYQPPNTLFELSTLAHEIGHTTTLRKSNIEERFLDIEDGEQTYHNEIDSYRYEYLFAKNIDLVLETLNITHECKDLFSLMLKRKAIQYNTHLLATQLNYLFFSGEDLDHIELKFSETIRRINPTYQNNDAFDWLNYASLSKPLSKLGYLEAYPKTFQA
jgi:hypothetical protein